MIYYRSYVRTNRGNYEGEILSFTTLEKGNGTGTADDPMLISNSSEWDRLVENVNNGMDMTGIHYALAGDITLTASSMMKIFNGHFDGRGFTMNLGSSASTSLFCIVGTDGVIENLNIMCKDYHTGGFEKCSPLTGINYGLVNNCDVRIEKLFLTTYNGAGGMCGKNYGTISYCHSYIYLPKENNYNDDVFKNMAIVGGICWFNFGLIDHCSFDGDMATNNTSNMGGMVAVNYSDGEEHRGSITNCVNRGTIRIYLVSNSHSPISIGGIAGSSEGYIGYCINEGRIVGDMNSEQNKVGGIVGGVNAEGTVMHCLNRGVIQVATTNPRAIAGGIAGNSESDMLRGCVNVGQFEIQGDVWSYCRAVVGDNNNIDLKDCYYSCNITDPIATNVTSWTQTINALNAAAETECWLLENGEPYLAWEKGKTISWVKLNTNFKFTSTTIYGTYSCNGDIAECGIEYRKEDEQNYHTMTDKPSTLAIEITLERLEPETEYEIRAYIITKDGERKYTESQFVTTDFASTGFAGDPILISTVKDMKTLARVTRQGQDMEVRTVRLTQDLDMHASEGEVWTDGIGVFAGEFDGAGHYIYNLRCKFNNNNTNNGFFEGGQSYIHDLHFYDVEMEVNCIDQTVFYVGIITGDCERMERCSVVGKLKFTQPANYMFPWCSIGGLTGYATSYMCDCYALVDFDSDWNESLGGVAGRAQKTERCYFGRLSSNPVVTQARGVVGNMEKLSTSPDIVINDCYYMAGTVTDSKNGTQMSVADMKNGTLLAKLNSKQPGVWTDNINGKKIDGGFPVLTSQGAFPVDMDTPVADSNPEFVYEVKDVNSVSITGVTSEFKGTELIIPEKVMYKGQWYQVTAIDGFAFQWSKVTEVTSISLPEGLKTLGEEVFNEFNKVTSLDIPASVDSICGNMESHLGAMSALLSINVSRENRRYCSVNGVLYSKDMKTLIKYPSAMSVDEYTIPEGVENVCSQAFRYCSVKHIILPSTTRTVSSLFIDSRRLLNDVTVRSKVPPTICDDAEIFYADMYNLHVPNSVLVVYRNHRQWGAFKTLTGYDDSVQEPGLPVVSMDDIVVNSTGTFDAAMKLDCREADGIAGIEFDMKMPSGLALQGIRWADNRTNIMRHKLDVTAKNDGCVHVSGLSADNNAFLGSSGDLIIFTLMQEHTIPPSSLVISNVILKNTQGTGMQLDDVLVNVTEETATDIPDVSTSAASSVAYTIMGTKVTIGNMRKGIYIVGGKKVVNQ